MSSTKDIDQIKIKLDICQTSLDCWNKSLQFVKKLKNVPIIKIKVLVYSLLDVTKNTLEHCKDRYKIGLNKIYIFLN